MSSVALLSAAVTLAWVTIAPAEIAQSPRPQARASEPAVAAPTARPERADREAEVAAPAPADTRQADEATSAAEERAALAKLRPEARDETALRPLALAMDAMRAGRWDTALERAAGDGPVAQDIIRWYALREGRGNAEEVKDFLARNADWPGLPYLKEKSEAAMLSAAPDDIIAFFDGHFPRTGAGALALARAYEGADRTGDALATIVQAWRTLALDPDEQRAFLDAYGEALEPHHWARLDHTLWMGWTTNPRRMEVLVSEDQWALAEARMSKRHGGGDTAPPEALADDPGYAYERYRLLKGDAKRGLLLARSTSAEALGRPDLWSSARRPMARALMREGALSDAYEVASTHFTTEGRDFADLEWLSGYLSLRLDEPERALRHFERFRDAVFTPISLGRAGYWLGRAHEALGDDEAAQEAYAMGAEYQTSFYGLLAAERAGIAFPEKLSGTQPETDWRDAAFTGSSVHKAAALLLASGEDWPAERFWTHLAESQDEESLAMMGKMLDELGQPHIQVMLGKRAAQAGLEIAAPYYALHPLAEQSWPVPTELVLAIARRESEFDPVVVSHAGARGLMQLMPGTAQDVARDLGIAYRRARLTSDPVYNARLGAEYLRQMARRYDGNPVLISIAYNAGPGRANRWQGLYGNPRNADVDVVDWIEGIPFRETRNYVMRVTESLPIYRARLGKEPLPRPFTELLKGSGFGPDMSASQ